jgi:biotin operon repressor
MESNTPKTTQSGYVATLQYLNKVQKPVSPHELALTLQKSRVTIQSALKRLVKNGWVIKEGTSPRATYRAVDPFNKSHPEAPEIVKTDPYSILAFIEWCRAHKYHVPEIAGEYVQYLRVMQK